ncbi:MAG: formate--tetrahydrofolate ligase [Fimbriimonadaceae bacterium]
MNSNLEIAQRAELKPISQIAVEAGLEEADYEPYGRYKAKLTYAGIEKVSKREKGKLVLVTAINPTPAGEGKTTVTIGLSQGLRKIGKSAIPATREPALGPVFGVKGGAAGGGHSQVLPMEEINLFFNGDFPAITAAHNLLAALIDAHVHHGNRLRLDTRETAWPRTVDVNDRALREIVVGLGGRSNGYPRSDGFIITPASEVMAVLCMARSLQEVKERLGAMVVGYGPKRAPITARELNAAGSMAALLRDAFRPNLVQTLEGGPALIHGGPFANIAHGTNSIAATECALGMADYTVTEAGFGADLGGEKFMNLVAPRLGRHPNAVVIVATVRALRHHGEGDLEKGLANLRRHVDHFRQYKVPPVVAINRFADDSDQDIATVKSCCQTHDLPVVEADPFGWGGDGCRSLAEAVVEAADQPSEPRTLYQDSDHLDAKLDSIVRHAYGGKGFSYTPEAEKQLRWLRNNGFDNLPVCVAKTQYSLSDDPKLINAPEDFEITIRELRLSAGAGFIVAVAGSILLMPGLGKDPAAVHIDVDEHGSLTGMF